MSEEVRRCAHELFIMLGQDASAAWDKAQASTAQVNRMSATTHDPVQTYWVMALTQVKNLAQP